MEVVRPRRVGEASESLAGIEPATVLLVMEALYPLSYKGKRKYWDTRVRFQVR